jgi:hypothetical protein
MLLVIWLYAACRHWLIDPTMSTAPIISPAKNALLPPVIFLLWLGVISFRNDTTVYIWLLMSVLEAADLHHRCVRQIRPSLSHLFEGCALPAHTARNNSAFTTGGRDTLQTLASADHIMHFAYAGSHRPKGRFH